MARGRDKLRHIQRHAGFDEDYQAAENALHLPQTRVDADLIRGNPEKGRRFAAPPSQVSRKPHLDALYGVGYVIAWDQLKRLQEKSQEGPLDEMELRQYVKLVEAVDRLSRGEREQQKHEKFDEVDDATLLAQLEEAKRILGDEK